jgi:hypothetical protein
MASIRNPSTSTENAKGRYFTTSTFVNL